MAITLNGTTGITTPEIIATGGPLVINASAPDNSVVIDSAGNVGIGTSSPTTKLHVVGNVTVNDGQQYCFGSNNYNGMTGSAASNIVQFYTNNAERARIDSSGNFKYDSGYGSVATAYGCRAWVNFNGTGTVAIRASGNVSTVGDNGTGDYTINFSTSMPDSNYSFVTDNVVPGSAGYSYGYSTYSSSSFRMRTIVGASLTDHATVTAAVFR